MYGYSETCIKQTPSVKKTSAWVPKFSFRIYLKINLHAAGTSVKQMQTPILKCL